MKEIYEIIDSFKNCLEQYENSSIENNIKKITSVTNNFNKSWSTSWIGYQASVYYRNFEIPLPGDYFSTEWGFQEAFSNPTTENWVEYSFDTVVNEIKRRAGLSNEEIREFDDAAKKIRVIYNDTKKEFIDLVEINFYKTKEPYLEKILNDTTNIKIFTQDDILKSRMPKQFMTRDNIASSQGPRYPPHISYESYFLSLLAIKQALQKALDQANKYFIYFNDKKLNSYDKAEMSNKVFIGHGRSVIWKELKDFLEDRLNLEWEEFNREPVR